MGLLINVHEFQSSVKLFLKIRMCVCIFEIVNLQSIPYERFLLATNVLCLVSQIEHYVKSTT